MAQHFLLSRHAKTLTLAQVVGMSDADVEATFRKLRWPDNGELICPHCGGVDAYDCRRARNSPRFRCRACKADFSLTSGTLFASHKLPLRSYLLAVVLFCNEVKGKSMLAMSRELGLSYKASFVLCHKLREAMAEEIKDRRIEREAEIDGAAFGGYVKPANFRQDRKDRRLRRNQSGKRKFVVVIRERGGETLPAVFRRESHALSWIRRRVAKEAVLHADEAPAWNDLHARFELKRINHEEAYSRDGACTNWAESFFSRMRRAEIGHHHHIAGDYLVRYAQEAAWREDNRRVANGAQAHRVVALAMSRKPSVDFAGYWQRHTL